MVTVADKIQLGGILTALAAAGIGYLLGEPRVTDIGIAGIGAAVMAWLLRADLY